MEMLISRVTEISHTIPLHFSYLTRVSIDLVLPFCAFPIQALTTQWFGIDVIHTNTLVLIQIGDVYHLSEMRPNRYSSLM